MIVQKYRDMAVKHRRLMLIALVLMMTVSMAAAQTPVPIEIDIPTDDMIGYLNDWIVIFAPILLFVGMIPVALGLLRYITNLFKSAFGGG